MKLPAAAALGSALALAGVVLAAEAVGSTAKRTVQVTEREYLLAFTPRSVPAGTVTFTVRNRGKVAHAFAVKGPGLATVRTPTIAPGATRSLTVTLRRPGAYTLWCPLARHAAAGMKATLRVGAVAVPPPATTTNGGYDPYPGGDGYR